MSPLSRLYHVLPPQTKDAGVAVSAVDAEGGFSGYASLFNVADLGGDIVMPGAFAQSLKERGPSGVKLLYQHDPSEPIGVWLSIIEDARGLKVSGQLMLELGRAREVHALMRAGVLDGLSIGFRTLSGRRDDRSGVRRLFRLDLWEISLVTFPMQEGARLDGVIRQTRGLHSNAVLAGYLQKLTQTIRRQSNTGATGGPGRSITRNT